MAEVALPVASAPAEALPRPDFEIVPLRGLFLVAKWAGLAYAITAGMLEYVFVKDGTSGGRLVVLTLSLVVYAIHVPLLIGFITVARYQPLAVVEQR